MLIYKITNTVNDKIYVGQTTRTLEQRKWQHLNAVKNGHKNHLYNAMRKYGVDKFKFEKICDVDSIENLNILERYYIAKYDCIRNGYNMVDGGNNNVMFIDEVKVKHLERMRSEATRNKISESMKLYRKLHPFTDEHKKKLSEKAKGNHNFGSGDTRSIGCYCVLEDGTKHEFHSYRDAWKWWSSTDNPFKTNAECVYQRKIKQSIVEGIYGYNKQTYEFPKWFKAE